MISSKSNGFLTLSPGYKFKTGTLKHSSTMKTIQNIHKKSNSTFKIYRAYDKQRLLHEIDNKLSQKQEAMAENKILKAQISKSSSNIPSNNWSQNQLKTIVASYQQQNKDLSTLVKQKSKQIEELKKSIEYSEFLQIFVEYHNYKTELSRLRSIIKNKKIDRIEQRRFKARVKNQQMKKLSQKQQGINQMLHRNYRLKQISEDIKIEIENYKSKNNQLEKNKKKLEDIVSQLGLKVGGSKKSEIKAHTNDSKMKITKTYQYNCNLFNTAVKTKKTQKLVPQSVPEVQQPNTTYSRIRQERKSNASLSQISKENEQLEYQDDSSNQSCAHSDPGSYMKEDDDEYDSL